MSISSILNSVFRPETWCCAIRFNRDEKNCILNDKETPFTVIKDSKRYWTADPFLIENNEKIYLFFEAFDRLQKKGVLGYREVTENSVGKIKVIYEAKSHLSFPFIYEENGNYFIIPESSSEGQLYRLKCTSFPDKWEKEKILIEDSLVDTVLFKDGREKYYISEKTDKNNCFDRVDLFHEENGHLIEKSKNPVKRDINNARGAGKVFEFDGMKIRPAQNCGKSYGEKINFNEILKITSDEFKERLLCDVSVNEVPLTTENFYTGIHTYNKLKNIEIIDLKLPRKFNFYNLIGAFVKLFRKVF
ncbi:MAG: hypothetical protein PUE08_08055 [Eubacteriales bacterium]|nr:hypothetical protein [Eubacteriales bacterium]